jgi:hypothetical protein
MPKITYALLLAICFSFPVTASVTKQAAASTSDSKPPTAAQSETASKPSKDQAWDLLKSGLTEDSTDKRATAVRVRSLLTRETRAVTLACDALGDPKPLAAMERALRRGDSAGRGGKSHHGIHPLRDRAGAGGTMETGGRCRRVDRASSCRRAKPEGIATRDSLNKYVSDP